MENWLKKFKSGKLFCPNSSCSNKFKHPKDLTEHLKLCMSPEGMHTRVLYRKTLPCMLCKKELDISTFHIHFRTTHKEVSSMRLRFYAKNCNIIICLSFLICD